MCKAIIEDMTRWYVIHTHRKQEDRAESNLKVLGVPIFNPKIRDRRYNQFVNVPTYVTKPLFPRYIFARFKINDLYHKVSFSRGCHSAESFRGRPEPINEAIIRLIQVKMKGDAFVKNDEEAKARDKVIVKDGPLKNFLGLFHRAMNDTY